MRMYDDIFFRDLSQIFHVVVLTIRKDSNNQFK